MATARIFVSYAHEDVEPCTALVAALEAVRADVWYDQSGGMGDITQTIHTEIASRHIFMILLTENAIKSKPVLSEVKYSASCDMEDHERLTLPILFGFSSSHDQRLKSDYLQPFRDLIKVHWAVLAPAASTLNDETTTRFITDVIQRLRLSSQNSSLPSSDDLSNATADELIYQAQIARARGRVLQTHSLFQSAVQRRPTDYEAVLGLAMSQYRMGEAKLEGDPNTWFTAAAQSFSNALTLSSSKSAFAWLGRGNSLYALGKYEGALFHYGKAIQLNPQYAAALSGQGNALRMRERFDDARAALKKAHILLPNNVEIASNYGLLLLEMAEKAKRQDAQKANVFYKEALEVYETALATDPNNIELKCGKGDALAGIGEYAKSIVQYGIATKLDSRNLRLWLKLGVACYEAGQYQAACDAFEAALRLDPTDMHALDGMGNALRHLHRWEEAEKIFRRALARNPEDTKKANLLFNLAKTYKEWGKAPEAADAQSQADALARKLKPPP